MLEQQEETVDDRVKCLIPKGVAQLISAIKNKNVDNTMLLEILMNWQMKQLLFAEPAIKDITSVQELD